MWKNILTLKNKDFFSLTFINQVWETKHNLVIKKKKEVTQTF